MAPVTRNLAILLTDIKGFTDKTSHKSRAAIQQLLDKHKELVLPPLEARGGKLVKTMGDAFLMTFESPTDAVLAGLDAQKALRAHNWGKPADDRIEVRIAVNQGEVNLADNDVFGEPVNIAARVQAVGEPGEVFLTDAVHLSMNKQEVPSVEVGWKKLKGIPEKIRVYRALHEDSAAETPEPGLRSPALLWGAGVLVAASVLGFGLYLLNSSREVAAPSEATAVVVAAPVADAPAVKTRAGSAVEETGIAKNCAHEINRFCPGTRGDSKIVRCLEPHAVQLSDGCKSWSHVRPPEAEMVRPEMKAAAYAPESPRKKTTAQKSILEQIGE